MEIRLHECDRCKKEVRVRQNGDIYMQTIRVTGSFTPLEVCRDCYDAWRDLEGVLKGQDRKARKDFFNNEDYKTES